MSRLTWLNSEASVLRPVGLHFRHRRYKQWAVVFSRLQNRRLEMLLHGFIGCSWRKTERCGCLGSAGSCKAPYLAILTPMDSASRIVASQNATIELHLGGYKSSSFLNDSFIFINLHWT